MIYEGALTDKFKEVIIDELYDTGALYRSMEIFSYEAPGTVYFDVQCEEYIVYHIERLNLLERLSEFDEFQEAYEKYIDVNLEPALQASLDDINAPDPNLALLLPKCIITVNGN
jgi:hypothetical protein